MLAHLAVHNLGVLASASIDPSPGFTVITGETGAGKTLLLGGLRLILGAKSLSSEVGAAGDRIQVDGLIIRDGQEVGVTRVVPRNGNSRAHLDGVIVSAAALDEALGSVVEIVGQHDQLSLRSPARVLRLLDGCLDDDGRKHLESYQLAWADLESIEAQLESIGGDQSALLRELDLVEYQAAEIEQANLGINEDLDTEADVSRLRNSEEIIQHLAETIQLVERLSDETGESVAHLRKVRELDPTAAPIIDRAEAIAEALSELAQATRTQADATYSDPTRLAELDERLTLIGALKRKYGSDIKDVLAFGADATARAGELKRLISDASDLDSRRDAARTAIGRAAKNLSDSRTAVAVEIAQAVKHHLGDLGLARAEVELRIRQVPPTRSGADTVELLFSSDHELALGVVSNVASGGELSRLVLAFRLAARDAQADCLVFDEVDSGLGGATATAMGRKLSELAASAQVLCVTHLPQVAVFAERHYVVERDGAVASVGLVNGQARIEEISRMMAGLPDSESGQNAAADLLSRAGQAQ